LIQPLVPDDSVVAFDVGILLRLAWLDVLDGNTPTFSLSQQLPADIFRAIVHPDCQRRAPPFNDLVEGADDPCRRQREVNFNAKAFAVEVIHHIQQPEAAHIFKAICHSPLTTPCWADQERPRLLASPASGASSAYPHIELQLTVNPVHSLVVPAMALHVAQIQKAQAKAPGPSHLRQANQQISNPLILLIQLGPVTIAGLADTECPAGNRNAHALSRHSFLGQFTTQGWPSYFFARASFNSSFCILSSANIFFRRRFSSSMALMSAINFEWVVK
jgi:hypothetical protein